jgi:hypothetical protein
VTLRDTLANCAAWIRLLTICLIRLMFNPPDCLEVRLRRVELRLARLEPRLEVSLARRVLLICCIIRLVSLGITLFGHTLFHVLSLGSSAT